MKQILLDIIKDGGDVVIVDLQDGMMHYGKLTHVIGPYFEIDDIPILHEDVAAVQWLTLEGEWESA